MRVRGGFGVWPGLDGGDFEPACWPGELVELMLLDELETMLLSMRIHEPLFQGGLRPMLGRPMSLMATLSCMGPSEIRELLESDPSLALNLLSPEERHNLQQGVIYSLRARSAQPPACAQSPAPAQSQTATPAQSPTPSHGTVDPNQKPPNATAQAIVDRALADNGKISDNVYDGREYEGWQYLRDVIQKSQKSATPLPDESVRTHPRPVWKDSQGNVHHIDWCGMWATRMYQEAGVDCYWKAGEGIKGDVEKVYSPKKDDVKIGDVIVGPGPNWHHAIVTGIVKNDQGEVVAFKTMNGNHPGIAPGEMQASSVCARYRPKAK